MLHFILSAGQVCDLLDIIFVLDASGSVGSQNFNSLLNFVADLTSDLKVSPSETHVGVIQYSSSAQLLIELGSISDPVQLEDEIRNIAYTAGGTATGTAIELARLQGFLNSRRSQGVPSVMMVLTDGHNNVGVAPSGPAAKAIDDGIRIIAVGIGSGIDISELNSFASGPSSVFQIGSFSKADFDNIIQPLTGAACSSKYINSSEGSKEL